MPGWSAEPRGLRRCKVACGMGDGWRVPTRHSQARAGSAALGDDPFRQGDSCARPSWRRGLSRRFQQHLTGAAPCPGAHTAGCPCCGKQPGEPQEGSRVLCEPVQRPGCAAPRAPHPAHRGLAAEAAPAPAPAPAPGNALLLAASCRGRLLQQRWHLLAIRLPLAEETAPP